MTRVTIHDLRVARYCHAGVRPWFRRHGFKWQDFLAHGIEADRLRATGDALVEPVIEAAERRMAASASSVAHAALSATSTDAAPSAVASVGILTEADHGP